MTAARLAGRATLRQPPEGRVRRSQVITGYGPGALVDLVDQAVLIGGLDFWRWDPKKGRQSIQEPRLRDAIADIFQKADRSLSFEHAFFEPPLGDDQAPTTSSGIPVLEFPRWSVCQVCRALVRNDHLQLRSGRYRHDCTSKAVCVPVRFVAACRRGHLEDFPWISFVHRRTDQRCPSHSLFLEEGATGDFSEIKVICKACNQQQPLSGAMSEMFKIPCHAERPWLGVEGKEAECKEYLRLLVRTATNSYFAQTVSALSIPERGRELEERVRSVWDVLRVATPETLATFRQIPKVQAAIGDYEEADVLATVRAIQRGVQPRREKLRTSEFRQLIGSPPEAPGDLPTPEDVFFARRVDPPQGLPSGVASLVLIPKLREVRAQIGFTRLEAVTPDLQGEFDLGVESAPLGLNTDWLPATEIRGEGIFIQLDEDRLQEWERRPAVRERTEELLHGYEAWSRTVQKAPPFPGARFYLLHSLSHLLITVISLECGYAASAIRERIYCAPPTDPVPMAGILLSTGTPGTEGTLGGLVEQGRALRAHLRRAFEYGRLCSNDPVCANHSPKEDYAERYLEGAACHGCLFIAECSCERFNRYLDRALVLPTLGRDARLAFFSERP